MERTCPRSKKALRINPNLMKVSRPAYKLINSLLKFANLQPTRSLSTTHSRSIVVLSIIGLTRRRFLIPAPNPDVDDLQKRHDTILCG